MMTEAATVAAVREVAENMRPRDREEFMAVSPFETHGQLVDAVVERYALHQDAYVFRTDDGRPVGVAGMIRHRPNVITLLFFATEQLAEIGSDLTRFVRKVLFPKYRELGVHRIECASIEGYAETHRWLEVLGLQQEAVMPGYGRGGETYIQFAWVKQ
jgi:hypothetical protein